jgi:exopolysaccharide biosynthesis polyprenyl glycosylphosphotransferase
VDAAAPHVDERTLEIIRRRRAGDLPLRRGWMIRRALVVADLAGLTAAFLLAAVLFPASSGTDRISSYQELAVFLVALPLWVVLAKLYGLYERDEERTDHSTIDDAVRVFHLVTVGIWLLFLTVRVTGLASPPLDRLFWSWVFAVVLLFTFRATARSLCRRSLAYLQNTIIVGAGDVGQLTARKLLSHPEYGINLVGFVDVEPKERRDDLEHLTLLGEPSRLPRLVRQLDVERVIIAFSKDTHDETLALIRDLKDLDVQIDIVPRLFEVLGSKVAIHTVEGIPLIGLPPLRLSRSSRLMKRAMDIAMSSVGLLVLGPFMLLVSALIRLETPGPALFRQVRRGAGETTFRIFKFRTMVADADDRKAEVAHLNMHARNGGDPRMFKVPDDPRVTRVGAFLRRTRIDELPQLINVLRGEMSMVGPRPLILDEDQHVSEWARKRLDLKPGITGLWQVLGASDIPFDEMTKLDYVYVTNWSLWEDFRLVVLTVPSLVRRRAAY